MFQIGDYVVNANNGVCRVEDIVMLSVPGSNTKTEYYRVIPTGEHAAKMFIPVNGKNQQIRPIMSKEEAGRLLEDFMEIEEAWVESDKLREKTYKDAIFSTDPKRLVSILKTMYMRSEERLAEGKKITTIDERYFRIAEKNLHDELAFVLDKTPQEVREEIMTKVRAGR